MSPDETLATMQTTEEKHNKARITINLAVNVTDTNKLPPWFIEKAAKPRCFAEFNMQNFRMM
jgi:hypothetical protein